MTAWARCAAMMLTACAVTCAAWGQFRAHFAGPRPRAATNVLINADEEFQGFLVKAKGLIESKDYARAIELLQDLLDLAPGSSEAAGVKGYVGSGFVQAGQGGRYVATSVLVNQTLGSMPPDGLKQYRDLYDAKAQRLYEDATAAQSIAGLQQVLRRYLHTSFGLPALDSLAAIYLDRGEFVQAARCYQALIEAQTKASGSAAPLTLVKAATACYLGGDAPGGDAIAAALRGRDDATIEVGPPAQRRQVGAADFLDDVRKRLALGAREHKGPVVSDWPGIGGLGDGAGLMGEAAATLLPRWQTPTGGALAVASLEKLGRGIYYGPYGGMPLNVTSSVRDGHVEVRLRMQNQTAQVRLPPLIHPVVCEGLAIYRDDNDVIACDVSTGLRRWSTASGVHEVGRPVERPLSPSAAAMAGNYGGGYGGQVRYGDVGRYWLTCGEGLVYALSEFPPLSGNPNLAAAIRGNPALAKLVGDTSCLVALFARSGKLAWAIGDGKGSPEIVRGCKFVSPPTYHDGRLYVIATYIENYHLLCLDARSGALVWNSTICQEPMSAGGYSTAIERASPPCVADGRVAVLTNAGVAAAFEADTGNAIWAFQYGFDGESVPVAATSQFPFMQLAEVFPPNPVLASRGRFIILPSDSSSVLSLDGADGRIAFRAPRAGQRYLSYVDARRALLSGDSLVVISLDDGKTLNEHLGLDVVGRPAVTASAVLASGDRRVLRMSLADYSLSSMQQTSGMLGNLVSTERILLAANAAGLCAYMDFDLAMASMTRRVEASASPEAKADALFQRAMFAHNSGHWAPAVADLEACRALAQQLEDSARLAILDSWLYRALVAAANAAGSPAEMEAAFGRAAKYASTDQEHAHLLLRLAKCRLGTGNLVGAVTAAQELSDKYGRELIVDYPVGPSAQAIEDGPDVPRVAGRTLAQELIRCARAMPDGAEACRRIDDQAKAALDKASRAGDPQAMAKVAANWPSSPQAQQGLLMAAETLYVRARSMSPTDRTAALRQATAHLSAVASDAPEPLRTAATVGLAKVHADRGNAALARLALERIASANPDQEVVFADLHGRLGDILSTLRDGEAPPAPAFDELSMPLVGSWTLAGSAAMIVRDHEGVPVRIGDRIVALRDDSFVLLDVKADSADKAVIASAPANLPQGYLQNYNGPLPWGTVLAGGMGGDGHTLGVATVAGVAAMDTADGMKVRYRKAVKDMGIRQPLAYLAAGQGVLVLCGRAGSVTCLDIDSGEVRWESQLTGGDRIPGAAPLVGNGVVCLVHSGMARLTCLDLRTGKVLWRKFGSGLQAQFASAGVLAVAGGHEVSVWEAAGGKRSAGPLWVRKYKDVAPRLLAAGGDRIAVWLDNRAFLRSQSAMMYGAMMWDGPMPQMAALRFGGRFMAGGDGPGQSQPEDTTDLSELELLSIVGDGAPVGKAALRVGSAAAVPAFATMAGQNLYVALTGWQNARAYQPNFMGQVGGLTLASYDTSDCRRQWSRELLAAYGQGTQAIRRPIVSRSHVMVVGAEGTGANLGICAQVTERSGRSHVSIDMRGDDDSGAAGSLWFGGADVIAGRLVGDFMGRVVVMCDNPNVRPQPRAASRPTSAAASRPGLTAASEPAEELVPAAPDCGDESDADEDIVVPF